MEGGEVDRDKGVYGGGVVHMGRGWRGDMTRGRESRGWGMAQNVLKSLEYSNEKIIAFKSATHMENSAEIRILLTLDMHLFKNQKTK